MFSALGNCHGLFQQKALGTVHLSQDPSAIEQGGDSRGIMMEKWETIAVFKMMMAWPRERAVGINRGDRC